MLNTKFMLRSVWTLACLLGLLWLSSEMLLAHSRPLPGALSLPACHSRTLVCQIPPDPENPDEFYPVPDGHCLDGLGTPIFCDQESAFPYLDLIALEGQNQEVDYLIVERDATFDASCDDGFAGPFPCENIDLLAYLPLEDIGGGRGSDIWGWSDSITGREYALMGRNNGTSIIDVTNPISPTYLGELPTQGVKSPWRDIKTYKDHAYVVADFNLNHGMQILDLTQLRNLTTTTAISATGAPTTVIPTAVFTPTAHYAEFSRAHNIAINEESGYAYTVGGETCKSGPHVINIQDPTAPTQAGCYDADGYTHDAQCVIYRGPDLAYNNREICFNSNVDTLTILDMTDKQNPQMLSRVGSPNFAYFHQSWLTEDQRYLLSDDEVDENRYKHNTRTYIWDVSDLHYPKIIGVHTSDLKSVDHNLYIRGNTVFEANYMSGLRIFSLDQVAEGKLTEIAYLDTFPEADLLTTGSAWSVYPYFESGTVIVSSIEDGLFVLQPDLAPEFSAKLTDNVSDVCLSTSTAPTTTVVFSDVLQLAAYNEFSGTLQLALEPQHSGLTLDQTDYTFGGNGSAAVNIAARPAAFDVGNHSFEISITDGTLTTVLAYEFGYQNNPPATVSFGYESGTVIIPPAGKLAWEVADGAVDYLLEIATDPTFASVIYSERTRQSQMSLPPTLDSSKDYYWRVQAQNACGSGPYSIVRSLWVNHAVYVPIVQ